MNHELWTQVDQYLGVQLHVPDQTLAKVLTSNAQAGLPPIDVSPLQGQFLSILASLIGAKRVLEVGTLGGYSSICVARALPADGMLITLELEPHHAAVAQKNYAAAGVTDRIEVRVGDALESLQKLIAENEHPFDMVFIDADKERCREYLDLAIQLARPGAAIIVDNIVRDGEVSDETSEDSRVLGVRRMLEMIHNETRIIPTAIQTVGSKGYDGFVLAMVKGT